MIRFRPAAILISPVNQLYCYTTLSVDVQRTLCSYKLAKFVPSPLAGIRPAHPCHQWPPTFPVPVNPRKRVALPSVTRPRAATAATAAQSGHVLEPITARRAGEIP